MPILLQTCCAPCAIECIDALRSEALEPTLFWFNPNIHPTTEYQNRRDTLIAYAQRIDAELILHGEYGLRSFLDAVYPLCDQRCPTCYRIRLEETAAYATASGYTGFSTTLLISPYQNHELLRATGEQVAERYGIPFIYRDFRPLFRAGQQRAREAELYRQKYCGCIFSEQERYQHQAKKKQAMHNACTHREECV